MGVFTNAKISLQSFALGLGILIIYVLGFAIQSVGVVIAQYWIHLISIYSISIVGCITVIFRGNDFQVAIRACGLGLLVVAGLSLATSTWSCHLLGWYLAALGVFHWSEYYATAITNPKNLSLSSYLLDHSMAYHIAVVSGFVEFLVEWYCFPDWKQPNLVSLIGIALVIGGESLRKMAMWTAGSNFNHYIRHFREDGHQLVTHGIFAYFRHPSYVGWFYWCIGTQVMLINPVCTVMYAVASWMFFKQRVAEEEITLLNFFGERYVDYQRRVGTGLPFIHGYRIDV